MPIYEYECEQCDHVFERLSFKGDTETIPCPLCQGSDTKKLISAGSFIAGSGIGACTDGPKGFS